MLFIDSELDSQDSTHVDKSNSPSLSLSLSLSRHPRNNRHDHCNNHRKYQSKKRVQSRHRHTRQASENSTGCKSKTQQDSQSNSKGNSSNDFWLLLVLHMPFDEGAGAWMLTRTREEFQSLLQQIPEILFEPLKAGDHMMIKWGGSAPESSSEVSARGKEGWEDHVGLLWLWQKRLGERKLTEEGWTICGKDFVCMFTGSKGVRSQPLTKGNKKWMHTMHTMQRRTTAYETVSEAVERDGEVLWKKLSFKACITICVCPKIHALFHSHNAIEKSSLSSTLEHPCLSEP